MLVYAVTVELDADVAAAWLQWMLTTHIPQVMEASGFASYRLLRQLHADADHNVFVIQYSCSDTTTLDRYLAGPAHALRADHEARFGSHARISRAVLEVIS